MVVGKGRGYARYLNPAVNSGKKGRTVKEGNTTLQQQ
jgi:hypothetical protein